MGLPDAVQVSSQWQWSEQSQAWQRVGANPLTWVAYTQRPTAVFTTLAYPAPPELIHHPNWQPSRWLAAHGQRLHKHAQALWPSGPHPSQQSWQSMLAMLEALLLDQRQQSSAPVLAVRVWMIACQAAGLTSSSIEGETTEFSVHCAVTPSSWDELMCRPKSVHAVQYAHPRAGIKHNARQCWPFNSHHSGQPNGESLALWVNGNNDVQEASTANVVCLQQGQDHASVVIAVPPAGERLQGLMEAWLIEQWQANKAMNRLLSRLPEEWAHHPLFQAGATLQVKPLSLADIKASNGVWLCNSLRGFWPVEISHP